MPDKKDITCLIIFTIICVLTVVFIHYFVRFSPSEIPYEINPAIYADALGNSYNNENIDIYRNIIGYANHYAVPVGIISFIFVITCGLFMFNVLADSPDYTLLILAAASVCFAVGSISFSQGYLFMSPLLRAVLANRFMLPFVLILIVIYVILNLKKLFIRYFTYINVTAAIVLMLCYLVNVAQDVYIPVCVKNFISDFPYSLISGNFIYYLVLYFLLACFLATYVYHVGKYAQIMTKSQVLKIQNRLITRNYESMVQNIQHASAIRHEYKNNIIAMDLMYKQGKTDELGRYIETLNKQFSEFRPFQYTENFTINAIVLNAADKAQQHNISFRANIYVPKVLNISDEDLCSLIINMLDNSIEACENMPEEKRRFIEFNANLNKGFLNISCKNSYSGSVKVADPDSNTFETTKINKLNHGFGIRQMNMIAKKYESLLDIRYGTGTFTVQTSLKNIHPPQKRHE